jgi:surface antigen
MNALKMALVGLTALALAAAAGCTAKVGDKEAIGTMLGAVAGGIAGSQVGKGRGKLLATGVGTLLGAALGNEIGKSLDRADRLAMQRTTQQSLETAKIGTTSTWKNPDSGNQGTITPRKTYKKPDGTYCREFQQTITVGGRTERAYGTACRQPDGSWKIIST